MSDPGVEMPDMKQEEEYKKLRHEAIMAREHKKEQDTDLMTPSPKKWLSHISPSPTGTPDTPWSEAPIIEEHEEVEASPWGAARSGPASGSGVCLQAIPGPGMETLGVQTSPAVGPL